MSSRQRASICVLVLCGLAVALVWAGWGGPVRATVGLLLVCLLPGLAMLLLFGLDLRPLEAFLYGVAASVAIVVLIGIALGATHIGFSARAWVTALGAIGMILAAATLLTSERAAGVATAKSGWPIFAPVRVDHLLYILGLCIAVLAVAIAHHSAVRHIRRVSLAELWAAKLAGATRSDVQVGVRNTSSNRRSFALILKPEGHSITRTLTLAPNETRVQSFALGVAVSESNVIVELRDLRRGGTASETATLVAAARRAPVPHISAHRKRPTARNRVRARHNLRRAIRHRG